MSNLLPSLIVNPGDPIFIGDFWGFLLSLPIALFLAFWISSVRNKTAVVVGAFAGTTLGFLIILGWMGTLVYSTPLPGASGASAFFGALFFSSTLGLLGGILTDVIIANANSQDYRRQVALEHE